jgi:predicted phage-related endonuclease
MSDFSPEIRNSAWWSGDSRMAANGRAAEAILVKQGKIIPEDISEKENVKMGHVMQPVIGSLAQDRLQIELKDADYAMTHPKETWLRSHFDFISADGTVLVEAKNYGSHQSKKFDEDAGIMPDADRVQCIHEATVHGISTVYLAVLLGGQELKVIKVDVTPDMMLEHVQWCAKWWGYVASDTQPDPETVEQCKMSWPVSESLYALANADLETYCGQLALASRQRKDLEDYEESLKLKIMKFMNSRDVLATMDGNVLATWKSAKGSRKFDAKAFQNAYPQMYDQFVREVPGSRRFLIK